MEVVGNIRKMQGRLDTPVTYSLPIGDELVCMNDYIEKKIKLNFLGEINCVHCNRKTNKSFSQGYCYPCFQKLAQCDSCIISPEKCHYEAGSCREPIWGDEFCMQDHIVYLANSSGLKVGITRASQVPTRWIDQGAIQAIPMIRVRTRKQSGLTEVLFKQFVADKTNWRTMLKNEVEELDLNLECEKLLQQAKAEISELQEQLGVHAVSILNGMESVDISYPVLTYPTKVSSLNFDKNPLVEGVLLGIKGQYLILDIGVINIRKFSGYQLKFSA